MGLLDPVTCERCGLIHNGEVRCYMMSLDYLLVLCGSLLGFRCFLPLAICITGPSLVLRLFDP